MAFSKSKLISQDNPCAASSRQNFSRPPDKISGDQNENTSRICRDSSRSYATTFLFEHNERSKPARRHAGRLLLVRVRERSKHLARRKAGRLRRDENRSRA